MSKFVTDTVMAIATHFAVRGVEITADRAKEIIEELLRSNPELRGEVDVDDLTEKIRCAAGQVGRAAYNEETLARFLEVPVADLATLAPSNLDTNVLYDHIRLEGEFAEWLREWGYDVHTGTTLTGLGSVEYVPDVYGTLDTLHGEFELCISFVCDRPPDEDRVFAVLGKIEAYAEAKGSFSLGDVFAVVTPHRFTKGSLNAITLQNMQESYSVVAIEGGDIHALEGARSPSERLAELQDKVRQAEEETRRSKIRKAAREIAIKADD